MKIEFDQSLITGVPLIDDQHREYFRENINDIFRMMNSEGVSDDSLKAVMRLFNDWFLEHIKTYDMKLAAYLNSKME